MASTYVPKPGDPGYDPKKMYKTSVPGVYRRGKVYVYKFRDASGKQRQGTAKTLREAIRSKAAAEAAVQNGTHQVPTTVTLVAYAYETIRNYTGRTSRGFSETTREAYETYIRVYIEPFFGSQKLQKVHAADIRSFLAHMNRHPHRSRPGRLLSKRTIDYTMRVLKLVLNIAEEDGVLSTNPASRVRTNVTPGPGKGREVTGDEETKGLTRAEVVAFLEELPTEGDRLLFRFMVNTGLRVGELSEIRWKDLDLTSATPHVHVRRAVAYAKSIGEHVKTPKTSAGIRKVPLAPSIAEALLARRGDPEELVFNNRNGERIKRNSFNEKLIKPTARRAGIERPVSPHSFRHTCASLLFSDGRNVKQVQRWLGHSKPQITLNTYIHLMDEGIGDASPFEGL